MKKYANFDLAIASFLIAFLVIDSAQEGTGLSFFFVGFLAPVGYYLNSLINSAEAVKFIPPTGRTSSWMINRKGERNHELLSNRNRRNRG